MTLFRLSSLAVGVAAAVCSLQAGAQIVTITTTATPVVSVPGLTGFATNGAGMAGMSVSATFSGGLSQTVSWAATGANAGGVSGTGWGLSLAGDTYSAPWSFTFANTSLGQLTHLTLNGTPGLTIFDRTLPSPGTPGSSTGKDFAIASGCVTCIITANYSGQTAIGSAAPVGDLWQVLDLTFSGTLGPRTGFSFYQDTDNDARALAAVPEPETYALMLAGLGITAVAMRRRARNAG